MVNLTGVGSKMQESTTRTVERVKNVQPMTWVYLALILLCLVSIICIYRYSVARKMQTAEDRATQVAGSMTPSFIKYFFG